MNNEEQDFPMREMSGAPALEPERGPVEPDSVGPAAQLADVVETLTVRAERLGTQWANATKTMKELTDSVTQLQVTARRNRAMIVGLIVSFVLDISITIGLVIVADHQSQNTSAIEDVQTRTSQQVLCPLYKLLVDSENPRAAANYPQGAAVYYRAIAQIRRSYQVLQCQ